MERLTEVILRGHLGKRFGTTWKIAVANPAEAIRALCVLAPGFEDFMRTTKAKYKVLVGSSNEGVDVDHLSDPVGMASIRIVPATVGAKSDGMKIIAGAALLVAAYYTWGGSATLIADMGFTGTALTGATMFVGVMGLSMIISGISEMLAPNQRQTDSSNSYLFTNCSNAIAQGQPVPILYGQMMVVPPLVGATIDTEAFTTTLLDVGHDGLGTWTGDGDTSPWGGSLKCL